MTKNGFDIQNISTKRTDFQSDHVLLLVLMTEKANNPFAFFKISYSLPALHTFGFARNTSRPFAKKKCNFCKHTDENKNVNEKT